MKSAASNPELLTAPELAGQLDISARALRYYESKGLIAPVRVGTTRAYNRQDFARMQLILRGKRLGFSLADIKAFLDLYDADPTQASQLRLLRDKVSERIDSLVIQRQDLDQTLQELQDILQSTTEALNASNDSNSGASHE